MEKLWRSFRDAFAGLAYCFRTQRNMTIHVIIGAASIVAALALRVSVTELLLLLTAVFSVLAAETFNTALEKAVDVATRDQNDLAHIAKDAAAGAVLLTAIFAVLIGLFIFGPRLWSLIVAH